MSAARERRAPERLAHLRPDQGGAVLRTPREVEAFVATLR